MADKKEKGGKYSELTDNEVVARIVSGGGRALQEVIYDRYAKKVYFKCMSLVKEQATAQDLTHDIMVKILTNLSKFKGTSNFSFWVRAITYNYCMDFLKKQNRTRTEEVDEKHDNIPIDEIEKENKILKELQLVQLERLFEELKPQDKAMLLMRYQDGLSIKVIAQTLKIGESAVKMRLKRSRDRLAELMKSE